MILLLLYLVLWAVACICFGVAAFAARQPRVNLVAAGLLAGALVFTIQTLVHIA